MYMLEALETSNEQITSTTFFRISEYPVPFIQVLLSEVESRMDSLLTKAAAFIFGDFLVIQ